MKKKSSKSILIIMAIVVIVVGLLIAFPRKNNTTKKREVITKSSIMLADVGISRIQQGFPGSYEKLYFGQDEKGLMEWDILNPQETSYRDQDNKATNTLLLLSYSIYNNLRFDNTTPVYKDSNLRNEEIAFASKALSTQESNALINTTQAGGNQIDVSSYSYIEPQLVGDKFFAPTAAIMQNQDYGIKDRHHRQKGNYYWMSSASKEGGMVGYISKCGVFAAIDKTVSNLSMRVATNLDHNAIVFVSNAINGKPTTLNTLTKVEQNQEYYDYKVTVKDSTQSIVVSNIEYQSNQIHFNYLVTGESNRLSAIISDEDNENIIYYGQLVDITTNKQGSTIIELPPEISNGKYHLSVFSEQYNGDKKTDYASEFINIDINK